MESYKDYTAYTQNDRINLDILFALDTIIVMLKPPVLEATTVIDNTNSTENTQKAPLANKNKKKVK